jgi:hypothetical protein
LIYKKGACSRGLLPRVPILAKWLRHFNDLAVGETAAPAWFSRENAEGAGMPPLLSVIEMTRHVDTGGKRGSTPREHVLKKNCNYKSEKYPIYSNLLLLRLVCSPMPTSNSGPLPPNPRIFAPNPLGLRFSHGRLLRTISMDLVELEMVASIK